MSNVIHFKRRPNPVDLEVIKVRCWRSWFSSQVMPTEIVEALVEEIELLHNELAQAGVRGLRLQKHAEDIRNYRIKEYDALVDDVGRMHAEVVKLHKKLAQTKLDAEIYEAMYDTKCKERDAAVQRLTALCVKLGIDYWPVNI